jgi:hypothetical protein
MINYNFMCVAFTANYSFSNTVDSEMLLMTDFMNFKIKLVQSFRCAYRDRMYIYIFIEVSAHTYINICIYTIFLKKEKRIEGRKEGARTGRKKGAPHPTLPGVPQLDRGCVHHLRPCRLASYVYVYSPMTPMTVRMVSDEIMVARPSLALVGSERKKKNRIRQIAS